MAGREVRQIMEAKLIARTAAQGQGQIAPPLENPRETAQHGFGVSHLVGQEDREQIVRERLDIRPPDHALALPSPRLSLAEEAAKTGITGAVHRIDEQRLAFGEIEAAAEDRKSTRLNSSHQCA